MTTHAMIDLETLGNKPDTTVLTLGGVKFNPNAISEPHSELYFRLDVDEQTEKGRSIDQSTLDWWSRQDKEVMLEALGDENRTSVAEVLRALNRWCVGADTIWCQGPVFDIAILENMYRQYDMHVPWPFWKIKDSRTLFGILPKDPRKEIKFDAHNALEDCKVQALCVQKSIQQLGLELR